MPGILIYKNEKLTIVEVISANKLLHVRVIGSCNEIYISFHNLMGDVI